MTNQIANSYKNNLVNSSNQNYPSLKSTRKQPRTTTYFTEYLGDLRRGDEVTLGAEYFASGVISESWMSETESHIARYRKWSMSLL